MVRFALPLLILFALFPSARAVQLGDSRERIIAHYGKPVGGVLDSEQGLGTYRWAGWRLDVEIGQGIVQRLLFTKDSSPINDAEQRQLLNDNGGLGGWQQVDHVVADVIADKKWRRIADGAEASTSARDGRSMSFVSKAWVETWTQARLSRLSQPIPPEVVASKVPASIPVINRSKPLDPAGTVVAGWTILAAFVAVVGFVGCLGKQVSGQTASRISVTTGSHPIPSKPRKSACMVTTPLPAASFPVSKGPKPKTLEDLSWQEFEMLIGELYRRQGYAVEMCAGDGSDGGVDLWLRKDGQTLLVQCKHWKVYKVGVSPVRELFGILSAEHATRAILVTTGKFTQDARSFAAGKPMELIDGGQLSAMVEEAKYNRRGDLLDVASWSGGFVQSATITKPVCPYCRSAMVLRRGKQSGNQFWGCSTYPGCRGKRNVRPELMRTVG